MAVEWISIGLSALVLVGSVVTALVKVSVAVAGNTQATKSLSDYLEKQDKRNDKQDERLEDHEGRIVAIETVHKVRGCDEASA